MRGILAPIFVVGSALELYGLFLVVQDIRDDEAAPAQQTPEQVRQSLGGKMWNKYTAAVATAQAVAGNISRRKQGVLFFALGLAVQTAGNVAALWIV